MTKQLSPLEALKEIERFIGKNIDNAEEEESWNLGYDIGIIETALKHSQELDVMYSNLSVDYAKKSKVLEIIKEKKVNVEFWFWFSFNVNNTTYEEYIKLNKKLIITQISKKELLREEFDLLKEKLK